MSANVPEPPEASWFSFDRGDRRRFCTVVDWDGHRVELYRSPTGRSFRVWVDGKEWKP